MNYFKTRIILGRPRIKITKNKENQAVQKPNRTLLGNSERPKTIVDAKKNEIALYEKHKTHCSYEI
jgi:hypothetical protein